LSQIKENTKLLRVKTNDVDCSVKPRSGELKIVTPGGTSIAAGYPRLTAQGNATYGHFLYSYHCINVSL